MDLKRTIKNLVGDNVTEAVVRVKYGLRNFLCGFLPMNDEIILESHPDMTCNSYALYEYMLKRGLNKKYKLTWLVRDTAKYADYSVENVDFLAIAPKKLGERIKTYIRCNRAKVVLTCHTHVSTRCVSGKQLNIFMDHGSQLKSILVNGKRFPLKCGYMNCQSPFFIPYNLAQYELNEDQVTALGLPRNDELFHNTGTIGRLIENIAEYDKAIFWAPTFRRHHGKERVDCDIDYPLGLPIFRSEQDAEKLNMVLARNNVLMIIKPHPSSDLSVIKEQKLSNIMFLYNGDLEAAGVQLNEILAQTDAMITDYSSIYYDYLLLDRPIGLTFDDYHEYAQQKGFVFDDPLEILKGEYLYDLEDLCGFAVQVAMGQDNAREERNRVKDLVHTYQDDRSSERMYNFIMEQLDQRW